MTINVSKIEGDFKAIRDAMIDLIDVEYADKINQHLTEKSDVMRALVQFTENELKEFFEDVKIDLQCLQNALMRENETRGFVATLFALTNLGTMGKVYLGVF